MVGSISSTEHGPTDAGTARRCEQRHACSPRRTSTRISVPADTLGLPASTRAVGRPGLKAGQHISDVPDQSGEATNSLIILRNAKSIMARQVAHVLALSRVGARGGRSPRKIFAGWSQSDV